MRIAVLGSLQVDEGRTTLSPRDRMVLLALTSRPGTEVSVDTLAEVLWGDDLPDTWHKVVQGCIVRLRKVLGAEAIQTAGHGYRLRVHRDDLDHVQFEDLLGRARVLLADGEPDRALFVMGRAKELWRGEPFEELRDWEPGLAESERLLELWRDAEDLHAESNLRAGRHEDVLAVAPRLVAEQPMREHRWALLALAQYRAGRQADALHTLHRARQMLVNELGLDPGEELTVLEEAILRQDPGLASSTPPPAGPVACPYLGLVSYDIDDAHTFFGRDAEIASCLRRLDTHGVLTVIGPSGSGKSSLARAGVAAALRRDGRRVHVVTPGPRPDRALTELDLRPTDVLVVDQCEEALALDPTAPGRTAFFERLVDFAEAGRGLLVVSMRADRLGELSTHPEFARLVETGLLLLGPMSEDDLRRAIEGPAAQAGLRLEPGLVDLLLREVGGEPAALPLLSHVLRKTWEHREGSTLTVASYAATGGVREAVAQSAENVFRGLDPGQRTLLRELMLRLVAPDEGGAPVPARVPRRAVTADDDHARLVEVLLDARLLASDGDTVEIAHESLAVAWPRLRSWLDEDVEGLRIMRHLSVAADSWDELGRPDSELYRGTRQARAAEWRARAHPSLTPEEQDFLEASAALAEKEERATQVQVRRERRLNRRLRLGLGAVAAMLAVAVVAGTLALTAARRADRQALVADARRLGAEALRSDELDRSLLLAAAGVRLDDSTETRNSLLATLDRAPALVRNARSAARVLHLTVNIATHQVAVMAADGVGLELYDGQTLRRRSPAGPVPVGGSVLARPDGDGYAATIAGDLLGDGRLPVVLLDRNGDRSAVQLGGIPPSYQVLDLGFPGRWYLGFSPSSRWFAASLVHMPEDGRTQTFVWDLRSPQKPVAQLGLGWVGSAPTLSPDGRTLYSGAYGLDLVPGAKGQLLVTNLPDGSARRTLSPADLGASQLDDVLALSPDGRTLAVGAGPEVVLVDTATLTPRSRLTRQAPVQALTFSPDGTRLASTGEQLVVWDLSTSQPVELLSQDGDLEDAAFNADGTALYTKTVGGLIQRWDLAGTRRFLATLPGEPLGWRDSWLALSPDLRRVAYTTDAGASFRVRDVATGTLGPVVTPERSQGGYDDLSWHPDGTVLSTSYGDPWVRLWDATTSRMLAERRFVPAPSVEGAAATYFSLDGLRLLVGTTEGRLHVLDSATLEPTREPIVVHDEEDGEAEADDVWNFVAAGDETVWLPDKVVDYSNGTVRPIPDLGHTIVNIYPSPDGSRAIVDCGPDGVGLLDAGTMTWISPPDPAQAGLVGYFFTTWSDDGSLVASANEGRLSHWDGRTGAYSGTVGVPGEGDPAFSKDGSHLLFASSDGSVLRWQLDPESWVAAACRASGRDLTEVEWRTYLPDRAHQRVCSS
ncbi:BTAD domain-containing putative transcriptional regulator [Knoellia sp. CPCC 206450]|uniref:nSTAND1 domain-containing NTPase n=1 Tax=Knoellia tibetensis TaxID=3404798 RepID=UPI003B43CD3A